MIYFYPRDNTTGCTAEGEAFRDLSPAFKKANTMILGVSPDTIASHEKFKAKYQFPFELLSDESQALCQLFDVIQGKKHVRAQVHGRGAQHVPDRRGRRAAPRNGAR